MSTESHLHLVLEYTNKTDIPCLGPGGLQSSCRRHEKASRLSAPAVLSALKPGMYSEMTVRLFLYPKGREFLGPCTYGERRAVSDMLFLLSSRYEEERLKARRERWVQSGRGGGGSGVACGGHPGTSAQQESMSCSHMAQGPALLSRAWSQS